MNKVYTERVGDTEPIPAATGADASDPSPTSSRRRAQSSIYNLESSMHNVPRPASNDLLLHYLSAARDARSGGRATPSSVAGHPSPVWNAVVAIAARHGLTPLLYTRLKQSGMQAYVPADVWERLKRSYVASAVRSMCFERDLRAVLRCLRSSGIRVIVLKGAYLAAAVYGDDALRPMTDVDLMVPKADLPRAHAVLLDMGRVRQPPEGNESRLRRVYTPGLSVGAHIDLCWTFDVPGGRSRLDTTSLWDRARPATIAGVEVLALSPEDLLLHLCLHASHRHGLGDGLRPLCDVSETIQRFRSELDWVQVEERAREWGASRYVGLMLHLARGMLGAAVPDAVLQQLVPGDIDPRILEAARESVLARSGYMERMPFFGRLGAKSLGEKLMLSWERIFLSRDEMAVTYPASRGSRHLYPYYALRLRDVIRTYWSHTFRRGRLMVQSRGRDRNTALVNWLSGKS